MGSNSKVRILCFHGYRQSDSFFREKIGSTRKLFKKYADFEFVCAPHKANIETLDGDVNGDKGARGDPCAWWFSKPDAQFSSRDVTTLADGFEQSVQAVLEFIRNNGPFDGLFGFSQGASMVHLLLALKAFGKIELDVKFAIFSSGFLSLSSVHETLVENFIDLPSMHIFGKNDNIVHPERSQNLSEKFPNPVIIIHDGVDALVMGQCVSNEAQKGHKEFCRSIKNDTERHSFRVYIHRRNKFIHAWLRITPEEVILERSKNDVVVWPLQYLRRYGYTSAGIFFFESGRRAPTGEGLHCFQSKDAEAIFQIVQSRVQDNANTSRAANMRNERARSSGPTFGTAVVAPMKNIVERRNEPQPVQRFGSEGTGVGSEYMQDLNSYKTYHRGMLVRPRHDVFVPLVRPRSVGETDSHHLPPDSFHPHRHNTFVDQRIVGNIISEGINPQMVDEHGNNLSRSCSTSSQISGRSNLTGYGSSQFGLAGGHAPPYVNISPQEVYPDCGRAPSSTSIAPHSTSPHHGSQPPTPTRTMFPIRWDAGAGSTNVICFSQFTGNGSNQPSPLASSNRWSSISYTSSNNSPRSLCGLDSSFSSNGSGGQRMEVVALGARSISEREATVSPVSPQLNYADVSPMTPGDRPSSRCSNTDSIFNYTNIDMAKTRALQQATANGTLTRQQRQRTPAT
ncbi:hypothetical protein WR25_24200 [Diploscapter pachys]|uniref:IRS-type PTB domain-containing protein n=1 Tax=Diploscapter pachys TaxID=2018661 RepID=A0A2A2LY39_9BILA|nr:hypothetical protein WR25_24200 [Diploscapter pachys]